MKARTDALEAQYAQEKHMFLQKAENERQSAVLAVKAEYAARMESLQEKYMARLEASYGTKKEQAAAQKGGAGDAPEGAAGKESDRG